MGKKTRGRVRTEWRPGSSKWAAVDEFVIPNRLTATAELPEGTTAVVEIEISEGRARPRSVCVSTDRPAGVGWATLSRVPVRNIVGFACLDTLAQARTLKDGTTLKITPLGKDANPEEVQAAVQKLTGYSPKVDDLERVRP
jgi:hypothetical protein